MNNNYPSVQSTDISRLSENNYIIFVIKDKKYALNIKNIVEVIGLIEVDTPEVMPIGIVGIFNYKGTMIKVIDLCPFLGFDTPPFDSENKLIIVSGSSCLYALNAQKIVNIENISDEDIQSVPYSVENSIIKSIFKINNETISVIDINVLDKVICDNNSPKSQINYSELFPKDEKSLNLLKIRNEQTKKEHEIFSFNFNLKMQNQYVLFTIADNNFYIDLKYVKEFASLSRIKIAKLPYVENYIRGMVNIKGDFLIVLDFLLFLNPKAKQNASQNLKNGKLIILEGKNFNIAIIADDIKCIMGLNDNYTSSYNNENSKYISSEFVEDNQLYSIINVEKVINDERLYINIE